MNISIFGLGYVGAVTAGCLAKRGHGVVGVDVQKSKVEMFNRGISPIVEPRLDELLRSAKEQGRLRATNKCEEAIEATELSIVCVGTPSRVSGALDLSYVRAVVDQIGNAVRRKDKAHVLVLRSTMLPGSTQLLVDEFLGDLVSTGQLRVHFFPEFLRESTAVADFEDPSLAVVGSKEGQEPSAELLAALFGESAEIVSWPTAEMVKYTCNAFHAAKITFANEIGRIGKQIGVDSRVVMRLVSRDTKLNLSAYYLKPGNPFGGSCLPKDLRALTNCARVNGVQLPMLESLLPSNERHLQSLLTLIAESGQTEACILGLSFKSNTDDLRESAMVEVAQTLLGRGWKLRIYDPALNLAGLVGANKRAIDTKMPHLASLLCPNLKDAVGDSGMILINQKCAPVEELKCWVTEKHHIIDVNGWPELQRLEATYQGFCW
ncbi:nucleotide sugar dehydrogenase [bacterium]|nr:nucleotide sugar dehydrogenase [bacterium]